MSGNDINVFENAEMADCDGEKVVTMMDVLQEQEDFEEDANAVLGASDDKNCTYSKGYIKRQALYACMTCCADVKEDSSKRAGVCLACSLSCHENHELIELYTKRNFRCDCGNPKFNSHPCQFTPNKTEANEENIYNQNFSGLYCICHRPYPDPESTIEQEMIQCIICEDWLHSSHLNAVVPPNEQYTEMICKACMDQNEFLHDYSDLVVNKQDAYVDILNSSSEFNESTRCNGNLNTETTLDTSTEKPSCAHLDELKPVVQNNSIVEKQYVTNYSDKVRQCEIEHEKQEECTANMNQIISEVRDIKDPSATGSDVATHCIDSKISEETEITNTLIETTHDKTMPASEEKSKDHSDETISSTDTSSEKIVSKEQENNEDTEPSNSSTESLSNKVSETEVEAIKQSAEIKSSSEIYEPEKIKEQTEKNNSEQMMTTSEATSVKSTSETEHTTIKQGDITSDIEEMNNKQAEKVNLSGDSPQTSHGISNAVSSPKDKSPIEKPDNRSQEQVEEDLLLADPMDNIQAEIKDAAQSNDGTKSTDIVDENKFEIQKMDTTDSVVLTTENETLSESIIDQKKIFETVVDVNNENSLNIVMNDHTDNKNIQIGGIKDNSNSNNELTDSAANGADILKRRHVPDTDNVSEVKKPKLDKIPCIRPRGVKKTHQGATFWPSNFRYKLCTCKECITMYKDLSVLFLIDPDDTVTAYEKLGMEKTDGKPASQYEKGMAALSSLGRVQQINALTEYAKMRDKLLEFLKSFKDRKVIVKEEDIKAFFADMKPVREPDGVYFCR